MLTVPSSGTAKTMVEVLPKGGLVRRNGVLKSIPLGVGVKKIKFPNREYLAVPIPWGDLETAYRSTGIPNITTLIVYPPAMIKGMKIFSPIIRRFAAVTLFKKLLQKVIDKLIRGPDGNLRERGKSYVYGAVKNRAGNIKEAWLETPEVYKFTAIAGVRCVENVLEKRPSGAYTPSLTFGSDFIFEIENTKRYDLLPSS